jgi:hypothetical protein
VSLDVERLAKIWEACQTNLPKYPDGAYNPETGEFVKWIRKELVMVAADEERANYGGEMVGMLLNNIPEILVTYTRADAAEARVQELEAQAARYESVIKLMESLRR